LIRQMLRRATSPAFKLHPSRYGCAHVLRSRSVGPVTIPVTETLRTAPDVAPSRSVLYLCGIHECPADNAGPKRPPHQKVTGVNGRYDYTITKIFTASSISRRNPGMPLKTCCEQSGCPHRETHRTQSKSSALFRARPYFSPCRSSCKANRLVAGVGSWPGRCRALKNFDATADDQAQAAGRRPHRRRGSANG
jgi:hypothetical protein